MPAIDFKFDKRINGIHLLDRESVKKQLKPLAEKTKSKKFRGQISPKVCHEPVYIPSLDLVSIETKEGHGFKYPIELPNFLIGHGYGSIEWKFYDDTPVQDTINKLADAGQKVHCICSCNPGALHLKDENIIYPLDPIGQRVYFSYDLKNDKVKTKTIFSARDTPRFKFHVPLDMIIELLSHPEKYSTLEEDIRRRFEEDQNFKEKVRRHGGNYMRVVESALRYFVENNCDISLSEVEEKLQQKKIKEKLLGK